MERAGAWLTGGGFAVLLAPAGIVQLTENYNDLLDFSRGYPQLMILGLFTIVTGVTADTFISRFGLTTMKIFYLLYPAMVFIFFSSFADISN